MLPWFEQEKCELLVKMTENKSILKKGVSRKTSTLKDDEELVLKEELDCFYKEMPITEDTSCGIWLFKGPLLQKFANKKSFVLLYGISGMIFSATYAYFSGTITTMEKRFKIPSKTMGE